MWVSKSEFESLKARVGELEHDSCMYVFDDLNKRTERITLGRTFTSLLSALEVRLEYRDRVCKVSLPSQGLERLKGCNTLEVFSYEEVLELLLQHLQVDLVKTPAQPAKAALKPTEAPNG